MNDTTTAAPVGASSRPVFYVARGTGGRITYFSSRNLGWSIVNSLAEAERFYSVSALTKALQVYAMRGTHFGKADIVRVQESTTAPKRELVTSGDLSLLDGPCVVRSYQNRFLTGVTTPWTYVLDSAEVFPNQSKALRRLWQRGAFFQGSVGDGYQVLPIREVPGNSTFTETVLS